MNDKIQEKLAIEIANKSLIIASLQAENEVLHSEVARLTADLDQLTAPGKEGER